nr:MAG TPA: hypothetical protein [Caudoviricetes sp.]
MDFIYKLILGCVIGRLLVILFAIIVVYIDKINSKKQLKRRNYYVILKSIISRKRS